MAECSKCDKKLGFLSPKHKADDGLILCTSCFQDWQQEREREQEERIRQRTEKRRKLMMKYVSDYLSNQEYGVHGTILALMGNDQLKDLIESDSLDPIRGYFEEMSASAHNSAVSRNSSLDFDDLLETANSSEGALEFLNELQMMYKLFKKKGIETNYLEILSTFSQAIEHYWYQILEEYLTPAASVIRKRLDRNVNPEAVIRELLNIPLMKPIFATLIAFESAEHDMPIRPIRWLFEKLEVEYKKEDVIEIVNSIKEEREIDNFEERLGKRKTKPLGDYEDLGGYEFEEYLKGMFKLLGYTALQTSLSGDQGADLVMSKDQDKVVVQAKKYEGKVSNKAVQEIVAAKEYYGANKAMVVTTGTFTKSAVELALRNNVELLDKHKLKKAVKGLQATNDQDSATITSVHCHSIASIDAKGSGKFKVKGKCPFCEEEINCVVEMNINEKKTAEIECSNCSFKLAPSIKKSISYFCFSCDKTFKTKARAKEHIKICKKRR